VVRPPVRLPPRYSPELEEIGHGGFATVYRTVDLELGVPVALKVPHGGTDRDPMREVVAELQTGARLRHPGIVQVLDARSDGAGQAYLVMELAGAGTLDRLVEEAPPPWPGLLELMLQVLDALAYAHARGVIHRDIKSGNILLARARGGRLVPKLGDFGLAKVRRAQGQYDSTRLGAGTLLYMPPEAFENRLASIHTGLDLYAFGVLLYQAVCGRNPWAQDDLALLWAKVRGDLLPPEPRSGYQVPDGLGRVIRRLLAPDPSARYQLAADVAADLVDVTGGARARPARPRRGAGAGPRGAASPSVALHRPPRFVGRASELASLRALSDQALASATGVVLRGEAGVGRTRLAEELCCELEESGTGRTLRVPTAGCASPSDALRAAVRSFLALGRLSGEDLLDRLGPWSESCPEERRPDPQSLWRWLGSEPTAPRSSLHPAPSPAARAADLAVSVLLAEGRSLAPVLVTGSSDADGAVIAGELLRGAQARSLPALVLFEPATGDQRPPVEGFEALDLGPLERDAITALLRDLLPPGLRIDGLLRTARGNPTRAVEASRITADDLRRRAEPAETVATVTGSHAKVVRPPDLRDTLALSQVAAIRLRSLHDSPLLQRASTRAMGLVSLLPSRCPREVLEAAFTSLVGEEEAAWLQQIIDGAQVAGLVRTLDDGAVEPTGAWSNGFVGGIAFDREEVSRIRSVAASALLDWCGRSDAAPRGWLVQAGRLLLDAGQADRAVDVLRDGAEALDRSDVEAARSAWTLADTAVRQLSLPMADPRRVQVALGLARAAQHAGDLEAASTALDEFHAHGIPPFFRAPVLEVRASTLVLTGEPEAAIAVARRAAAAFRGVDDMAGCARAHLIEAEAQMRCGRLPEALAGFELALDAARAAGSLPAELAVLRSVGRARRMAGERAEALRDFTGALDLARQLGDTAAEGIALRELGNLALLDGRHGDGEELFGEALEVLRAGGFRAEVAATLISLGELARARGDLAAARSHYTQALGQARAYGFVQDSAIALLNLALTDFGLEEPRLAARRLDALDRLFARGGAARLAAYVESLRLAVRASESDWDRAEEALETLTRADRLPPDPDLLRLLERGTVAAQDGGHLELARGACGLALDLARSLGESDWLERIRQLGTRSGLGWPPAP